MERELHPEAEKALTKAWYAALEDLYSTLLVSENTTERNRAAEIVLDYSIRMGQSLNAPFIPRQGDVYEDEEKDSDD